MAAPQHFKRLLVSCSQWSCVMPIGRCISTSSTRSMAVFGGKKKKKTVEEKQELAVVRKQAEFVSVEDKSETSFAEMIKTYEVSNVNRRGHVEFIYAALKVMKEFGVEKDIEYYKKLLSLFPKGKLVPKTSLQIEFMHFPMQQECAVRLLEQMEDNGVFPDEEIQMIIMETFGYRGLPMRKFARMNYWMPKFRYASPWPLPKPIPDDTLQVALLAVRRMTSVDLQTDIQVYQTSDVEDSVDKTWIVSGQSPQQKQLLAQHPTNKPLYIDGAFRIWLRNASIAYFVLRSDPDDHPTPRRTKEELDDVSNLVNPYGGMEETSLAAPVSIHQQEDSTYMALCATGTSSRDSLLSWLRILHHANPRLNDIPVIFTLKAPTTAVVPLNFTEQQEQEEKEEPQQTSS